MLTLAGVDSTSTVLDIGCGDGRVCFAAASEKGARGIGLESLDHVYSKAIELRREAGLEERVELFHTDFSEKGNQVLQEALDRANVVFVFLLPSDMQRIVDLAVESIRRKYQRAKPSSRDGRTSASGAGSAATAASPSSSNVCPCPCPSVRTRIVSWTFSLPSSCSSLALPLRPTQSLQLQSKHTQLHLYDLCYCQLQQGVYKKETSHAYWISRAFADPAIATASDSSTAAPSPIDVSSINWGHALNTIDSLLARLAAVHPRGLFIECDLRIAPGIDPARATIEEVIMAHDAGASGPSFVAWYDALHAYHVAHPLQPLGLKLDFKSLAAVEPVLKQLKVFEQQGKAIAAPNVTGVDASHSSSASSTPPRFPFLWLNADILRGPSCPAATIPIDATEFLRVGGEDCPQAVRSVGWCTGREGEYTHEDVTRMLAMVDAAATSDESNSLSSNRRQSSLQLTYPLRASMVRRSWQSGALPRLLSHHPHSTLTIWTSVADQAEAGAREEEEWIRNNLPKERTFIDLVL
jgi:hypothetical protein